MTSWINRNQNKCLAILKQKTIKEIPKTIKAKATNCTKIVEGATKKWQWQLVTFIVPRTESMTIIVGTATMLFVIFEKSFEQNSPTLFVILVKSFEQNCHADIPVLYNDPPHHQVKIICPEPWPSPENPKVFSHSWSFQDVFSRGLVKDNHCSTLGKGTSFSNYWTFYLVNFQHAVHSKTTSEATR